MRLEDLEGLTHQEVRIIESFITSIGEFYEERGGEVLKIDELELTEFAKLIAILKEGPFE